jgi:ABC-type transporter Mla subunit MlaD
MALQDLTPQLRTRLSRIERLAGLFVTVATLLLMVGLGYYVYQTAKRKGWFDKKVYYFTFVRSAAGLKVGDPVKLMGFDAGQIIEIKPMPPDETTLNIYVRFEIKWPHYGYMWESSRAKVTAADFLGKRSIEVTKGTNGYATYVFNELRELSLSEATALADKGTFLFSAEFDEPDTKNVIARPFDPLSRAALQKLASIGTNKLLVIDQSIENRHATAMWDYKIGRYVAYDKHSKGYYMLPDESPALTERLEKVVNIVEEALPHVLDLTNKLTLVLANASSAAAHADDLLADARPVVANLQQITANLRDPRGSLGDWLIPTNINRQLTQTLASANLTLLSANTTVTNTDARLETLVAGLNRTLDSLAGITSNLNAQVQANTNLVSSVNRIIIHSDEFIQGLKRHWLLRSAFKDNKKEPAQSRSATPNLLPPKLRK